MLALISAFNYKSIFTPPAFYKNVSTRTQRLDALANYSAGQAPNSGVRAKAKLVNSGSGSSPSKAAALARSHILCVIARSTALCSWLWLTNSSMSGSYCSN